MCLDDTFWERAAHSVYRMFSLYLALLIVILVISHFGFEGGTLVLIAPVPSNGLTFYFLTLIPLTRS